MGFSLGKWEFLFTFALTIKLMRKFIGIFITMFVIAFLTCCKNREGDDSAVYEQGEFLLTNIFKDTLKRYVVLTPQFAETC